MPFRLNDLLKVTDPGSMKSKILQAISKPRCTPPVTGDASVGRGSAFQADAA